MKKINTVYLHSQLEMLEQGNHTVSFKGWEGVASHVIDDNNNVEGVVIWFPSARLSDFK